MKRRDVKDLSTKSKEELMQMLTQLREEMKKNTLEIAMRKLKNVSFLREKKKDIARILTKIREKELTNL